MTGGFRKQGVKDVHTIGCKIFITKLESNDRLVVKDGERELTKTSYIRNVLATKLGMAVYFMSYHFIYNFTSADDFTSRDRSQTQNFRVSETRALRSHRS